MSWIECLSLIHICHINAVSPGMWSGGIVGLKSILGARSRTQSLEALSKLSELGYVRYSLNAKTKKLSYQITDWVLECSGEECMNGSVYATEGYGFLCLPRGITDRLVEQNYIFDEADAWLDPVSYTHLPGIFVKITGGRRLTMFRWR